MKQTIRLKLLAVVALVTISLMPLAEDAMANDLVSDVKSRRKENKAAKLDVSDIARKYIPIDSDQEAVFLQLEKQGFKCYPASIDAANKLSGGVKTCYLDMRNWYRFGFGDEFRIHVSFKDGKVTGVVGTLIFLAL